MKKRKGTEQQILRLNDGKMKEFGQGVEGKGDNHCLCAPLRLVNLGSLGTSSNQFFFTKNEAAISHL